MLLEASHDLCCRTRERMNSALSPLNANVSPKPTVKLSYCVDSSRYDKISYSNRSASRNHDLCKFYFTNEIVNSLELHGILTNLCSVR